MFRCAKRLTWWAWVALWLSVVLPALPAAAATVVRADADTVLLLIPDGVSASDPLVTVWLDAGREEGLHLKTITDSQFLALNSPATSYAGLILPDTTHVTASDAVVAAVAAFVNQGGRLLLTYDAGTTTAPDANGNSFYSYPDSRFSALAGVSYARYADLGVNFIGFGNVVGPQSTWRTLRVPPGKSMLYPTSPTGTTDPIQGLTSYYYGFLNYPSFVTVGAYNGSAVLTSPNFGLVAGLNSYGKGKVLFVNTPLGYMKSWGTDGLLLHGFLRYFAVGMIQLPYLSPLPQGKAGMVLNVHTDCGNSLADIKALDNAKFWDSGPYSIDFTAGPDCDGFGDRAGLNVPGNTTTDKWISYFVAKGHEVGSHGGWIHNYFGPSPTGATENNQFTYIAGSGTAGCSGPSDSNGQPQCNYQDLLVINKKWVDAKSGRPGREYAAPEGNTPKWSVSWLENNGVVGYYWVGDTGMAPTRGYREGQLLTRKIWALPITPYGTAATFEEFSVMGISPTEASTWLTGLVDFAVRYRTSRLVYFHEPGVTGSDTGVSYLQAVQNMLARGKSYAGRFSLYTMPQLADFLNDRENVAWRVSLLSDGNLQFNASTTGTLKDKTWVLTKQRYAKPTGLVNVAVTSDTSTNDWVVTASGAATSASFNVKPLAPLY